jgi:beta-lactamase superfamily II metal-dependent hydrolase
MPFEVDFLAVGNGEKSGDAIAIRYGNLSGTRSDQKILVIDGGTQESGQNLVDHVQTHYKTDCVDAVFSSHPDIDHASGLKVVLENLDFGMLVMHRPWQHATEICDLFKYGITPPGLKEKLKKAIDAAHDLEEISKKKGKPIVEPFAGEGSRDGSIIVLGPSKEFYEELLPHFRDTPEAKSPVPAILQKAMAAVGDAITWVAETMNIETLDDSGVTSAENNSSVILLLVLDGHKLLFTGDAGIPALTAAADYAQAKGISLSDLRFMQVPHHGSKRNVGPTILNRIKAHSTFISAGKDSAPKHPAKKVTNALIRRGAKVYTTAGISICHYYPALSRIGYGPITPIPFYEHVEA